jgi:ribonuclease D
MADARLITEPAQLADLCDRIEASSRIALDTEFVPEYTFAPQLCLIQIATENTLAAVDPFELPDLERFWSLLVDPAREVVVHAGKEEMNFCYAQTGRLPSPLIDVQIAAGLVGLGYPLSLENLLQKLVKSAKLNKGETRTDWRQRPLTESQVEYALDDVRYLLAVRDRLGDHLTRLGRSAWLDEEMERFRNSVLRRDDERWRRVAGAGGLGAKELAVLRELVEWRDSRARRLDKPTRWVLRDDLLVELARRQPTSIREMHNLRGMGSLGQGVLANDVLGAVQRGLDTPSEQWPERMRRREAPEDTMVLKILSAALIHLAQSRQVAPSLLGSNDDLKELVDMLLLESPVDPPPKLAQGWRGQVCGDYLRDLLHGRVHLRIVAAGGKLRLVFEDRPESGAE